jgi:hypothetical protein
MNSGTSSAPSAVLASRDTAIAQIAATPTFEKAWLNPRRPPPSCASPISAFFR